MVHCSYVWGSNPRNRIFPHLRHSCLGLLIHLGMTEVYQVFAGLCVCWVVTTTATRGCKWRYVRFYEYVSVINFTCALQYNYFFCNSFFLCQCVDRSQRNMQSHWLLGNLYLAAPTRHCKVVSFWVSKVVLCDGIAQDFHPHCVLDEMVLGRRSSSNHRNLLLPVVNGELRINPAPLVAKSLPAFGTERTSLCWGPQLSSWQHLYSPGQCTQPHHRVWSWHHAAMSLSVWPPSVWT